MRNYLSRFIIGLLLVGLILLSVASVHFAPPLFGWLIIAAILLVYSSGMLRYWRISCHVADEVAALERVRLEGLQSAPQSGTVAERIRKVRELAERGIKPDPRVFSDLLSARESVGLGRSAGGVVVLLGLAGTFYGLMAAISDAGNSLDPHNTGTTLDAIRAIFHSMKGIFGTSFAGLVAALFLNLTHSVLASRKTAFMADMEEFTQFELLPGVFGQKQDAEVAQNKVLWEQMQSVVESVQRNLVVQTQQSAEQLRHTLEGVLADLTRHLDQIVSSALISAEKAQKQAQQDALQRWNDMLEQQIQAQARNAEHIGKTQAQQVSELADALQKINHSSWEAMREQWSGFMAQNRDALNAVLAIAERVGHGAEEQSGRLLRETGERLEQMIRDVQDAFSKLVAGSAELVAVQKTMLSEVEARLRLEQDLTQTLAREIGDAGVLMRVNQSEFQASLEMFRRGVEALLEKFTGNSAEQESQRSFVEQLQATLEAFSEKASEVLIENALRTQEILLEVLEQSRQNQAGEG